MDGLDGWFLFFEDLGVRGGGERRGGEGEGDSRCYLTAPPLRSFSLSHRSSNYYFISNFAPASATAKMMATCVKAKRLRSSPICNLATLDYIRLAWIYCPSWGFIPPAMNFQALSFGKTVKKSSDSLYNIADYRLGLGYINTPRSSF